MPVGGGDLSRDAARRLAREELSRKEYADARPPLLVRVVTRMVRAVMDAFNSASTHVPAGRAGLLLLLLLLLGAVGVLLVRLRPARSTRRAELFGGGLLLDADQHRRRADELAARNEWALAVRERLRALVRELELRGVLDRRLGRTAGEVAAEVGAQVPALAADLHRAAVLFDEIWYGGRPAGAASYAGMVEVDRRVCEARRVPA